MRHPLWVINASMLVLLLLGEGLLFLLQQSIPRKASLVPGTVKEVEKSLVEQVDLKKIYGVSDLFGTYVPEVPVLVKEEEFKLPSIPDLPVSIPLSIPIEKPPVFIAPLGATLRGVVYLHDSQNKSMAIIQLDDSKVEQNYRVGELIKDAQILKILPNKVMVVRSNGQQETLYLREADAQKDLSFEDQKGVDAIKVILRDGKYYIPRELFVNQVGSLGQFIDMLDLTTVYQKGKSVGCRVGKALPGSLGAKLGFYVDDIVKLVDSTPITDLSSRLEVYDQIVEKKTGDSIVVGIDRGGKSQSLTYVLSDNIESSTVKDKSVISSKQVSMTPDALYNVDQKKEKILQQRVKLAPTAHQIQMDEQKKLLEARRKNMLSNRLSSKK